MLRKVDKAGGLYEGKHELLSAGLSIGDRTALIFTGESVALSDINAAAQSGR